MKAKSRRRLLISSVAMLLVAMLALGTATFAWFTTDTSTTATGLNVKTTKASHLVLSNFSTDWTTQGLDYGQSGTEFKPTSSNNGVDWFYAGATSNENGAAKAGSAQKLTYASTGQDNVTDYVYVNQLNIRNAGDVDVNSVTINFSLNDEKDGSGTALDTATTRYMRFAICEARGRVYNATTSTNYIGDANAQPKDAAAFQGGVYAYAADSASPITAVSGSGSTQTITYASSALNAKAGTSVSLPVGTLKPGTYSATNKSEAYYMIYVWFEGTDTDCKDANAGHEIPNFTITVSGTSASA